MGTKLHQSLVITGLTFCCVSDGFIFGQMSGMIDGLRNDGSIQLSDNDVSWIASIINITCFCGFGFMTILTETLGRRKSVIILSCPVILTWIMVYFAEDKDTLIISRVIVGISFGGILLLSYACIGEYLPPSKRPLYLNMISSVGTNAGTMLGHILSIFMHWRKVALLGIIPSSLSALLPFFWVESPSWLASKGRLKECERSFRLLHLPSEASDKELYILLNDHREKENQIYSNKNSLHLLITTFLNVCKTKYFWNLFRLLIIIIIYRTMAGRVLFSTFAITMLQDITRTPDILFSTFLVDGLIIIGTSLSCILVSKFNMRSLILISGIIANIVQLMLVVSLFIWRDRSDYVAWIKVSLLALYFIIVNAGPYAVIETLLTELCPLDIKSLLMLILGVINGVLQFFIIKFAPNMFVTIGYYGVFLTNTLITFLCLIYLYVYLPETKGRTLQEIEYYFKYNSFEVNTKLSCQQEELLTANNKDKQEIDTN